MYQLLIYQMIEIESVIMFLIERTLKTAKRYSQLAFDQMELNITVDQWVLLKIIDEKEPLSQKELGEFSIRDKASIARTMVLLEKKGYVLRTPIPENRREYNISLSKTGKQFVHQNMDMIREHRKKSLEGFSEAEVQSLQDMLLRIQRNFKGEEGKVG